MRVYQEHKEYQNRTSDPTDPSFIRKVAAGPLESDDGRHMVGSMFIVQATKEAAEKFSNNDPFARNKVWKTVNITRWISPMGIKAASVSIKDGDIHSIEMVIN